MNLIKTEINDEKINPQEIWNLWSWFTDKRKDNIMKLLENEWENWWKKLKNILNWIWKKYPNLKTSKNEQKSLKEILDIAVKLKKAEDKESTEEKWNARIKEAYKLLKNLDIWNTKKYKRLLKNKDKLSEPESKKREAILKAHETPKWKSIFEYNMTDIKNKIEIMQEAWREKEEYDLLIEKWICWGIFNFIWENYFLLAFLLGLIWINPKFYFNLLEWPNTKKYQLTLKNILKKNIKNALENWWEFIIIYNYKKSWSEKITFEEKIDITTLKKMIDFIEKNDWKIKDGNINSEVLNIFINKYGKIPAVLFEDDINNKRYLFDKHREWNSD